MKKLLFLILGGSLFLSSCTLTTKSMREPNARVEFQREDFDLSQQFKASATSTKILQIDFNRLFSMETGSVSKDGPGSISLQAYNLSSIPIVGSIANQYLNDNTASYALYNLMMEHPGYDVVFYPSFTTKVERPIGLGIYTITTVEVTARLGKLK